MKQNAGNRKKLKFYKEQTKSEISQIKQIDSIKNLIRKDKISKALSELNEFLKENPKNGYAIFQHANILMILEKLNEAKKEYQYIIDENLESKYASIYKLGLIALKERNYDLAHKYFKYNVDNSPYDEIFSKIELSKMYLEKGEFKKAEEILKITQKENDDTTLIQLASIYRTSGKLNKALKLINNHKFSDDQIIQRDLYMTKGSIERDLGQFKEARETFEKAIKATNKRTHSKVVLEYAYLEYVVGNYEKAENLCLEVIKKEKIKQLAKAYIIIGNINKQCGDHRMAEKCYIESVKHNYAMDVKGYLCLGTLLMTEKRYDEAKIYLEKYKKLSYTERSKNIALLKLALIDMKQNDLKSCEEKINIIDISKLDDSDIDDYRFMKTHITYYAKGKKLDKSIYTFSQLMNYDIDKLINHIDKVHTNENGEKSIFNPKLDLQELVLQIPELLRKATLAENKYYEIYQIQYEDIGTIDNKPTDLLRLVVFPETKKVLTMFPVKNIYHHNKKQQGIAKTKKTQIEKFNQKYGTRNT